MAARLVGRPRTPPPRRRRRRPKRNHGHRARGHARRQLGAAEGMPQLPLVLLRLLAKPLGNLVLDAALRQPHKDARLPPPPKNVPSLTGRTRRTHPLRLTRSTRRRSRDGARRRVRRLEREPARARSPSPTIFPAHGPKSDAEAGAF